MEDKKKLKLILIIVIVSVLTILGVTYAFYNYTRTGENNKLIAGEVYLRYVENNQLTLNNAIPETKAQALLKENNVFSFKVEGKNTSTNDIFYDIIITYGDNQNGKTRLNDSDIRIYLEKDGVPIVDGITLEDWNKRVIYTDKMPALTNNHTVYNYELRMWVDEDVTVSDTDITADYTTTIWNNSYASMRINVNSGAPIIESETPASCFGYKVTATDDSKFLTYNYPTIVYNRSTANVASCKSFFVNNMGEEDMSDAQDGYHSFCNGTGTVMGFLLEDWIATGAFGDVNEVIPALGVIEKYEMTEKYYELNTSAEAVTTCTNIMMQLYEGQDGSDAQDGYQSLCSGTGTILSGDIYDHVNYLNENLDEDNFEKIVLKNQFISLNVFVETNKSLEATITNYDEDNCGLDVTIPSYINNIPVTVIDFDAFNNKVLTNITIPKNVIRLNQNSFLKAIIKNVIIYGKPSMSASFMSTQIERFVYGGTCAELNSIRGIFYGIGTEVYLPQTIITSDSNSCIYTG